MRGVLPCLLSLPSFGSGDESLRATLDARLCCCCCMHAPTGLASLLSLILVLSMGAYRVLTHFRAFFRDLRHISAAHRWTLCALR